MRLCTLLFAFILVLVGTQANKKEQWREKKAKHLMMMKKYHGGAEAVKINNADHEKKEVLIPEEIAEKRKAHKYWKKHYKGKYAAKKKAFKNKKKTHKTMSWLNINSEVDCDPKCLYGEVCISGPVVNKPICVLKKELGKSMKLFHRYHKKELKEWKKFQKKNYKSDWKLKMKEEKFGRTNSHDLEAAKMKKYRKHQKFGKAGDHKSHDFKKWKKHQKHNKHHHIPHEPKGKEAVCDANDLGQMKTRMMGWFHLLHGQDRDARKAHGGSIGKFYKHVSIKKELRDYKGKKCQCMKSAMWQFHQMDKDHSDSLNEPELAMLEENTLEPCMRPYLQSCDQDGDKMITSDEWCCCFTNILPPCFKMLNKIRKSGNPVTFMPRCDKEGYYMHEQCKGATLDNIVCWCVDYNGNELKDTAKEGRAHCSKMMKYGEKNAIPLA